MEEFVQLKQLASELGLDRSHMRKYVLKCGIKPHKRRTLDSGGQQTLVVNRVEAEQIRNQRREEGFLRTAKGIAQETGFFYVIRLVPEYDMRRIKLGIADDVAVRLTQHRTAAPTAILVKCWPCKRSWESTTIDYLSAVGCRLIRGEVFDREDVAKLIARADQFFALMPPPHQGPQFSLHVPAAAL